MTIKKLQRSGLENAINYITECPLGTFGNNCRRECGYCLEKYHCHHINGSCFNGCLQGYRGEQCKHRKCSVLHISFNKRFMSHIAHLNNGFSYHYISVFWYSINISLLNFELSWNSSISIFFFFFTILNLHYLLTLA